MNETWTIVGRQLSRHRGALLGGIGSAAAVAITLDPHASIASSSIKFALAFAMVATLVAIGITTVISIADVLALKPYLPRAIVRKRS
jgi:hypothetical protein